VTSEALQKGREYAEEKRVYPSTPEVKAGIDVFRCSLN